MGYTKKVLILPTINKYLSKGTPTYLRCQDNRGVEDYWLECGNKKRQNRMTLAFLSSYCTCVYFLNFLLNNPSPNNPEPIFFEETTISFDRTKGTGALILPHLFGLLLP
jgi:hypothetical protein